MPYELRSALSALIRELESSGICEKLPDGTVDACVAAMNRFKKFDTCERKTMSSISEIIPFELSAMDVLFKLVRKISSPEFLTFSRLFMATLASKGCAQTVSLEVPTGFKELGRLETFLSQTRVYTLFAEVLSLIHNLHGSRPLEFSSTTYKPVGVPTLAAIPTRPSIKFSTTVPRPVGVMRATIVDSSNVYLPRLPFCLESQPVLRTIPRTSRSVKVKAEPNPTSKKRSRGVVHLRTETAADRTKKARANAIVLE